MKRAPPLTADEERTLQLAYRERMSISTAPTVHPVKPPWNTNFQRTGRNHGPEEFLQACQVRAVQD